MKRRLLRELRSWEAAEWVMALLIVAAVVLTVAWVISEHDCVKWETVGPPTYVNAGGVMVPIENRRCIEWRKP